MSPGTFGTPLGTDPRFTGKLSGDQAAFDELEVKKLKLDGEAISLRVEGTTLFIDVETVLGTLSAALPLDFKQEA